MRDIVRDYVVETLGSPETILVVDETGFLKQGKASCGVTRQYAGSAGKITNCQVKVFAAYVSSHGHALIDRQFYVPKDWAADRRRRAGAHVPEEMVFATKPALAARMIGRAAAHVPFSWMSGDSIHGVGEIEMLLRRLGKGYILGITGNPHIWSWNARLSISGSAASMEHLKAWPINGQLITGRPLQTPIEGINKKLDR